MIYITSDLHLMHNQEFIYKTRGYDSLKTRVNNLCDYTHLNDSFCGY